MLGRPQIFRTDDDRGRGATARGGSNKSQPKRAQTDGQQQQSVALSLFLFVITNCSTTMSPATATAAAAAPSSSPHHTSTSTSRTVRRFQPDGSSLPPPCADFVLALAVGNSRVHWAWHDARVSVGDNSNNNNNNNSEPQRRAFEPTLFWRTKIPPSEEELRELKKKGGGRRHGGDDGELGLEKFLPEAVREQFWGEQAAAEAAAAAAAAEPSSSSRRRNSSNHPLSDENCRRHLQSARCPAVHAYLVSTCARHAAAVARLLAPVPALVFQLTADDFVDNLLPRPRSKTNNDNNKDDDAAPPVAAYRGMGADRVAHYCAARLLFPRAAAHLVVDGGTALTYTTATTTCSGEGGGSHQQLAGGIGPGLALSCRALYDYTVTALPLADRAPYRAVAERVARCEAQQQPLPTLVPASTSREETMKDSLLGCVLQSRALLLCSVVRGFLEVAKQQQQQQQPSSDDDGNNTAGSSDDVDDDNANSKREQQLPAVVVTGGDADVYTKLLQPHHSHVVETTPQNEQMLGRQPQRVGADANDEDNNGGGGKLFQLHNVHNLFARAVQGVLQAQDELWIQSNNSDNSEWESVRRQLLGQRVATRAPTATTASGSGSRRAAARQQQQLQQLYKQGTVLSVSHRGRESLDGDKFAIFFDDAAAADEEWGLEQIYDGLLFFHDMVEKTKPGANTQRGIRILNKAKDAREAAALLEAHSSTVRDLLEKRKAAAEEEAAATKKRPASLDPEAAPAKKAKTTGEAAAAADTVPGESFVGQRVAKSFGDLGIYFGHVTEFLPAGSVAEDPNRDMWGVEYDDGDTEDLTRDEIQESLALYQTERHNDEQAKS